MAKPNWISLSRSEGTGKGSVSVTASSYQSSTSSRSGSLVIKTVSGLTKTVSIEQTPYFYIDTNISINIQNDPQGSFDFQASITVHQTDGNSYSIEFPMESLGLSPSFNYVHNETLKVTQPPTNVNRITCWIYTGKWTYAEMSDPVYSTGSYSGPNATFPVNPPISYEFSQEYMGIIIGGDVTI